MKESLTIRNFGPIREVEFEDIKPLTLLIGPSGSGKSTVMKTLSMMRWLYKKQCIAGYLKRSGFNKQPFKFRFKDILRHNGLHDYLSPNTEIIYRIGKSELRFDGKKLNKATTVPAEEISLEKIVYISDKRAVIPSIADNFLKIREDMPYLSDTFDNFVKAYNTVGETAMSYLGVKIVPKRVGPVMRLLLQPIDDSEDREYMIKLSDASSGIQNASSIHYLVEYFTKQYNLVEAMNRTVMSYMATLDALSDFKAKEDIGSFPNRRLSLFIEEPELGLYPDNQLEFLEYLVENCFNRDLPGKMKCSMVMATHSPYILNALNLLTLRAEKGADGASIPFEQVSVYNICNGYLEDLAVEKQRLFNTQELSETISYIYDEYDSIRK